MGQEERKTVMDKKIEENAISLLKEIRIISGINSRKTDKIDHSDQLLFEFKYINYLIDKFKDQFKLEGFMK